MTDVMLWDGQGFTNKFGFLETFAVVFPKFLFFFFLNLLFQCVSGNQLSHVHLICNQYSDVCVVHIYRFIKSNHPSCGNARRL